MHFYFYLRGLPQYVSMAEAFLSSQYWRWNRIDIKTGESCDVLVQGGLRKSIFGAYEYVIPEECLPELLAVMGVFIDDKHNKSLGVEVNFTNKLKLFSLTKIFGAERISDKTLKEAGKIPTSHLLTSSFRGLSDMRNIPVSVHPIGIKRDRYDEHEGFYQEML